jgi:Rrf2 family protein
MLSHSVEYALRATLFIAREYPASVRLDKVAAGIDAPRGYLAKVLSTLVRARILGSARGPGGGFRLMPSPVDLALADVVHAIDGNEGRRCLLGRGRCGENPGCTAHARWAPIANEVDAFFGKTTLADLLHTPTPLSR